MDTEYRIPNTPDQRPAPSTPEIPLAARAAPAYLLLPRLRHPPPAHPRARD